MATAQPPDRASGGLAAIEPARTRDVAADDVEPEGYRGDRRHGFHYGTRWWSIDGPPSPLERAILNQLARGRRCTCDGAR